MKEDLGRWPKLRRVLKTTRRGRPWRLIYYRSIFHFLPGVIVPFFFLFWHYQVKVASMLDCKLCVLIAAFLISINILCGDLQ